MPDERLPKKILYGELQVGKRSHGGQKKRYKDTLKASLKDFNIPTESWEQIAQDRTKWRAKAAILKNLFWTSYPEPEDQLTRNLVESIRAVCRWKNS